MSKTIKATVVAGKFLSVASMELVASFAMMGLTIDELGQKMAASFAKDGVTRKEAHADVVHVLCGNPDYAVDIQSTGYFVGGTAAQQAYSRVMRAAFPSGKVVHEKKEIKVPAALRAAVKALLKDGWTAAQIKACL